MENRTIIQVEDKVPFRLLIPLSICLLYTSPSPRD